MAQRIPISFGTGANPGRVGHDGEALLLNCYAENAGKEGKIPFPIWAIEGLTLFSTLTDGGDARGLYRHSAGELLAISARLLFSIDPSGTSVQKGGIPSDGFMTFSQNRASPVETAIVGDGLKFLYIDGLLSTISDVDLPPSIGTDWLNGYTLYFLGDGRYFFSEIDDAGNIDALSFIEAEGSPDGLVFGHVRGLLIWLFGEETTEIHGPTGNVDIPFARLGGAFFEFGCAAAGSVTSFLGGVALVAAGNEEFDGVVVVAFSDGSKRRISNHAVERDIDSLSDRSSITAMAYSLRGHEMLVLSSASWTWVFDGTIGEWHKRESYQKNRWRAEWHTKFQNKHIVQDFEQGRLYQIDPDAYDENGAVIKMRIRAPIVHAYPTKMSVSALFFDMAPGQGLNASGSAGDPKIGFRYSKNGGKSWSNERLMAIGKIGEYPTTTKTRRLGKMPEDGFIPELTISASVIRGFTGASMDATILK